MHTQLFIRECIAQQLFTTLLMHARASICKQWVLLCTSSYVHVLWVCKVLLRFIHTCMHIHVCTCAHTHMPILTQNLMWGCPGNSTMRYQTPTSQTRYRGFHCIFTSTLSPSHLTSPPLSHPHITHFTSTLSSSHIILTSYMYFTSTLSPSHHTLHLHPNILTRHFIITQSPPIITSNKPWYSEHAYCLVLLSCSTVSWRAQVVIDSDCKKDRRRHLPLLRLALLKSVNSTYMQRQ